MNISDELNQQLIEYAKKMSVNKTAAVSFLITQGIQTDNSIKTLEELTKLISNAQSKAITENK